MKEIFENNFEKYKSSEKYDEMYGNYQDDLLYILEYVSETE